MRPTTTIRELIIVLTLAVGSLIAPPLTFLRSPNVLLENQHTRAASPTSTSAQRIPAICDGRYVWYMRKRLSKLEPDCPELPAGAEAMAIPLMQLPLASVVTTHWHA